MSTPTEACDAALMTWLEQQITRTYNAMRKADPKEYRRLRERFNTLCEVRDWLVEQQS